jgi:arsenite-transporting ATPase
VATTSNDPRVRTRATRHGGAGRGGPREPGARRGAGVPAIQEIELFGGKGGAGKTTLAAAAAIRAAETGERVLIVSTDPAHSLGDALGVRLTPAPRVIRTRRGTLEAAEVDPGRSLARWLSPRWTELVSIGERGTYLDRDEVERLLESSLPGATELLTIHEVFRLAHQRPYDRLVVDTAPAGHTLRLLATPTALRQLAQVLADMQGKHQAIVQAIRHGYVPDEADALIDSLDARARALSDVLTDRRRTAFTWVLVPETVSVAETREGVAALGAIGIVVARLIVNRITTAPPGSCRYCDRRRLVERQAVADLVGGPGSPAAPIDYVPLLDREPVGVAALRRLAPLRTRPFDRLPRGTLSDTTSATANARLPELLQGRSLLVVCGKGGVGKSTVAAATALVAARTGPVLLMSVDPAHSLHDVLQPRTSRRARRTAASPLPATLTVRELDAPAEFAVRRASYQKAVDEVFDAIRGAGTFDAAADRQIVRELLDLAPPGIDQIFAIVALLDALVPANLEPRTSNPEAESLVIIDAAATGHLMQLLDLVGHARAWVHSLMDVLLRYREVRGLQDIGAELVLQSRRLRRLEALLTNPDETAFVVVTKTGAVPGAETRRLVRGLRRRRAAIRALVVNGLTPGDCRRCRARAAREAADLHALRLTLARTISGRWHTIRAPAAVPPPVGPDHLLAWQATWTVET